MIGEDVAAPAETSAQPLPKKKPAAPAGAKPKKVDASGDAPKKVKATAHPPYSQMVKTAISTLKDKKGSSRAAILKHILENNEVGDNLTSVNSHLRKALNRGVEGGIIKQVKGVGANGRFGLSDAGKPSTKKSSPKKKMAEETAKPKAVSREVKKKAVPKKKPETAAAVKIVQKAKATASKVKTPAKKAVAVKKTKAPAAKKAPAAEAPAKKNSPPKKATKKPAPKKK